MEKTKATALTTLELYKAQLTLIESCLRAGRHSWALETLRELNVHGKSLEAALAELASGTSVSAVAAAVMSPPAVQSADGTAAVVEPSTVPAPAKKVWTPPNAEQVQRALDKMFGHLPECGNEGDLVMVSFNGHLLDLPKAQRLVEPLKWFIKRGHIVFFQETNRDALKYLSNETGYGLNVSHRNERGQAVGILFHPRIKWLGQPYYHDYITDIPGHPEWKTTLRPALQRKVRDTTSGAEFTVIDIHPKSNLGGPDETRPVRRLQFEMFVADLIRQEKELGENQEPGKEVAFGPIILGGDMNTAIEKPESTEMEPLTQAGFVRVANPQGHATYFYKGVPSGQFDGFYTRGFEEGKVGDTWIPQPLEAKGERWFYSELSDHMPAFTRLHV